MNRVLSGIDAARDLLSRGGRIAFPPALGEPDLIAELPEILGDAQAEVVMPYRTRTAPLCFGPNVTQRAVFGGGRADGLDYMPVRYGLVPQLIERDGPLAIDVAVVRLSPPNPQGMHNIGPSATLTADFVRSARHVIGEIDPGLPWTEGDSLVPASLLTLTVAARGPLQLPAEAALAPSPDWAVKLARNVVSLVPDGAGLEIGMGSTAQAVVEGLATLRGLRIFAGLLSPPVRVLLESGAADPDWCVPVGEAIGPASLMEFIDRNRGLNFQSTRRLHDPLQLARHPKFMTVNSVLAVDLLGRASCEGDVRRPVGGLGGLIDFMIGGSLSSQGRNILVLASTARDGRSRIVTRLPSEEVSVPTFLIDFVVTEWGVASLRGATRRECAERMLLIAHPDFRADLESAFAKEQGD